MVLAVLLLARKFRGCFRKVSFRLGLRRSLGHAEDSLSIAYSYVVG